MSTQAAHSRQRKELAEAAAALVESVKSTRYQHDPVINVETGTYYLDCSEFLSLVLRNVLPGHYREIPKKRDWPCPRAHEYYDFLDQLIFNAATKTWLRAYNLDGAKVYKGASGWQLVEQLVDARPGDVIAWRFKHIDREKDTGHVLIVADKPEPARAGVVAVRAFDSTKIPHFDDARSPAGGVGVGTILFQVDRTSGAPVTFRFGPEDHFRPFPIVIGRPEPFRA